MVDHDSQKFEAEVIIKKISVDKLFGFFDHEIPLNASGITIVIGENGLGKTVILEATNAFFEKNFRFFVDLEFRKITYLFESNESWEVTKSGDQRFLVVNRVFVGKDSAKSKPVKIPIFDSKESVSHNQRRREMEMMIRRREMHRMETKFLDSRNSVAFWDEMERQRFLFEFSQRELFAEGIEADHPKWFSDGLSHVRIKLIETQRLITAKERGGELYINTVAKSSEELIEKISSIEKLASAISTELDSTYPSRLVQKLKLNTVEAPEELNVRLSRLDALRKELSSLGLIESTQDSDFLQISGDQRDLVSALKLYVEDSYAKLAPYEDIAKRIKIFMDIVNSRFKHKTLDIKKKNGFVFRSKILREGKTELETISPKKLSSGEQNELILFYELIFKASAGDMIFIDEPELSLHISWQNKFISDLKQVTSINNVSVVIATHSPDIIDENWDLSVSLKGLE